MLNPKKHGPEEIKRNGRFYLVIDFCSQFEGKILYKNEEAQTIRESIQTYSQTSQKKPSLFEVDAGMAFIDKFFYDIKISIK